MGYGITIRVRGAYALFTRPEMKVERVSYEVITPSAARGMLEAVYWKPAIRWVIDKIHVMNEIAFTNIRRNEVSVKASTSEAERRMNGAAEPFFISATDTRQQRAAMILRDVDYIIEAHFDLTENAGNNGDVKKHYNMIVRRLRQGQHFHQPFLGTREFAANVELFEEPVIPPSPLGDRDLGWMLYDLDFSDPENIQPKFFHARLVQGVLDLTAVEVRQ